MNRRITVLQTAALPLGYAANKMERETGFEPATSTLARLHSTTELFPLITETWLRIPEKLHCIATHSYYINFF